VAAVARSKRLPVRAASRPDLASSRRDLNTAGTERLREFIFACCPQPFDLAVFAQYITGSTGRRQEGSLSGDETGPGLMAGL
jgi:hypothetical protein